MRFSLDGVLSWPKQEPATQSQVVASDLGQDEQYSKPEAPRRAVIKQAALIWLASRVMYCLLTYFGVLLTLGRSSSPQSFSPDRLLVLWDKADATWYLTLSTFGYAH